MTGPVSSAAARGGRVDCPEARTAAAEEPDGEEPPAAGACTREAPCDRGSSVRFCLGLLSRASGPNSSWATPNLPRGSRLLDYNDRRKESFHAPRDLSRLRRPARPRPARVQIGAGVVARA